MKWVLYAKVNVPESLLHSLEIVCIFWQEKRNGLSIPIIRTILSIELGSQQDCIITSQTDTIWRVIVQLWGLPRHLASFCPTLFCHLLPSWTADLWAKNKFGKDSVNSSLDENFGNKFGEIPELHEIVTANAR